MAIAILVLAFIVGVHSGISAKYEDGEGADIIKAHGRSMAIRCAISATLTLGLAMTAAFLWAVQHGWIK